MQRAPGSPGSRQASAIALFLCGAGYAVVLEKIRIARKRTEGARDARGPKGPTGLDASRHRGLSKSLCLALRSGSSDRQGVPQVRQTQGVPRAVFLGLFRIVPGGRRLAP